MSVTNPSPRVEAFSLSHVQVLDGSTNFLTAALAASAPIDQDVYGVSDASLDPNTDSFDNNGDNRTLSTWSFFNYADVKVTAGYLSFPLIARLTGESLSSSGMGGASPVWAIDVWSERSMNVSPFSMIIRCPSRDEDGVIRTLTFGIYKFQPMPMAFTGPSYQDGLKVDYNGRVLPSLKDELGNPFPDGKYRTVKLLSTV